MKGISNDQAAVEGILRDLAFSGITPPEGSRVRGSFRQARYLEPFALFVEHADGRPDSVHVVSDAGEDDAIARAQAHTVKYPLYPLSCWSPTGYRVADRRPVGTLAPVDCVRAYADALDSEGQYISRKAYLCSTCGTPYCGEYDYHATCTLCGGHFFIDA